MRESESKTGRGVSPVIGVILMVAIAVILAAVVGAFALGFGEQTDEAVPAISADVEQEIVASGPYSGNERITIIHEGGDVVPMSELEISTNAQCYDDALLSLSTKRGQIVDLPTASNSLASSNIEASNIFQTGVASASGLSDQDWGAGDRLSYQIDDDDCGIESNAEINVEVVHKPSNSIIVEDTLGTGFQPAALETQASPATPSSTSTHTLVLDGITYGTSGNSGDQVDKITVDYGTSGASLDGLNQDDITVTMTRTLAGGLDRDEISVNNGNYGGSTDTFDLSAVPQTDVAGPITIEIDGIDNPTSTGSFDVDITLKGDAGPKSFTETLEIEN